MQNHGKQRGEGKIGCIISLLVLAVLIGAAIKAVPILFSNNDFVGSIESIAGRAAIIPQATIELQIRDKAKELGIPEALAPGAILVSKSGDSISGMCTVRLRYTRKIDFYGVYTYPMETNLTKSVPFLDATK